MAGCIALIICTLATSKRARAAFADDSDAANRPAITQKRRKRRGESSEDNVPCLRPGLIMKSPRHMTDALSICANASANMYLKDVFDKMYLLVKVIAALITSHINA